MIALLLVPILVCGYIVATKHPWHSLILHRFEGQLLYLHCARHGILCVAAGFAILVLWQTIVPSQISIPTFSNPFTSSGEPIGPFDVSIDLGRYLAEQFSAWAPENANNKAQENILYALEKDTAKLAWIIEGSINSLIAAYVWCAFSRKRGTMKTFAIGLKVARDKASKDGVKLSESDIKKIRNSASREYTIYLYGELVRDEPMLECLFESFLKGVVIVLCMDSRKVFVGRVVFMGEPNESSGMDKEVTIVPFYSGVEEQVSLQVDIKSDLSKVETVTLKQEKLVYAHYYKPGFQNNTGIHEDLPNASEATRGRGKSV